MRALARWCSASVVVLVCLLVAILASPLHALMVHVLQADSTGTIPTTPKAFAIFYFLMNVVPLITALVTKHYNSARGTFAEQSNAVKMAVYVVGTVLAMYAFQAIGLAFDPNALDITNLGPDIIDKVVKAGVGTLLVKTGISSAKTK